MNEGDFVARRRILNVTPSNMAAAKDLLRSVDATTGEEVHEVDPEIGP